MADVKWIKLNVGMFDGNSFKKIKKAKIGGESFRDKLTAIWFELMDLAGKCNAGGMLIESQEIPFASIDDIAILIDREPEELELCMQFFIKNRMISVIDDVYMLSNWSKYQNEDGLEKIREQNRIRQKRWYENHKALPNVIPNVSITDSNATDIEEDKEEERDKERVNYQQIVDMYHEICISYPKVVTLSDKRKKAIKARLNKYSMDDFEQLFINAEQSDFLKGSNNRNWSATFDWLINDTNMAKVLEGNYCNRTKETKTTDSYIDMWRDV